MNIYSGLVLSQKDGRPMYLQIIEQVKQKVAIGDWKTGQEIPSIRALAVSLKISVITIRRAYLELEREGVIVTRQGKGSFIADSPDLGENLSRKELQEHLERAVELSIYMGLSPADLQSRLRKTQEKAKMEAS